jgi:hypothetical protein
MPVSKHYKGHGDEVMASMKKTYGDDAERVFYATENKRKKNDKKTGRKRGAK